MQTGRLDSILQEDLCPQPAPVRTGHLEYYIVATECNCRTLVLPAPKGPSFHRDDCSAVRYLVIQRKVFIDVLYGALKKSVLNMIAENIYSIV